jgi:hypothetical protein
MAVLRRQGVRFLLGTQVDQLVLRGKSLSPRWPHRKATSKPTAL